jgi:hypothetical protein
MPSSLQYLAGFGMLQVGPVKAGGQSQLPSIHVPPRSQTMLAQGSASTRVASQAKMSRTVSVTKISFFMIVVFGEEYHSSLIMGR